METIGEEIILLTLSNLGGGGGGAESAWIENFPR